MNSLELMDLRYTQRSIRVKQARAAFDEFTRVIINKCLELALLILFSKQNMSMLLKQFHFDKKNVESRQVFWNK